MNRPVKKSAKIRFVVQREERKSESGSFTRETQDETGSVFGADLHKLWKRLVVFFSDSWRRMGEAPQRCREGMNWCLVSATQARVSFGASLYWLLINPNKAGHVSFLSQLLPTVHPSSQGWQFPWANLPHMEDSAGASTRQKWRTWWKYCCNPMQLSEKLTSSLLWCRSKPLPHCNNPLQLSKKLTSNLLGCTSNLLHRSKLIESS